MKQYSLVCDCRGSHSLHFQKRYYSFRTKGWSHYAERDKAEYNTAKAGKATLVSRLCKQLVTNNNYLTYSHFQLKASFIPKLTHLTAGTGPAAGTATSRCVKSEETSASQYSISVFRNVPFHFGVERALSIDWLRAVKILVTNNRGCTVVRAPFFYYRVMQQAPPKSVISYQ
jgi:hypothetical protein